MISTCPQCGSPLLTSRQICAQVCGYAPDAAEKLEALIEACGHTLSPEQARDSIVAHAIATARRVYPQAEDDVLEVFAKTLLLRAKEALRT